MAQVLLERPGDQELEVLLFRNTERVMRKAHEAPFPRG